MTATDTLNPLALIVEDSPEMARVLTLALERSGILTMHAASGPEALQTLADRRPDVMLLDIGLPDMSGWEVLEAVKNKLPLVAFPVIVLTAFNDPANRLVGKLQPRVFRYLTKPADLDTMIRTVQEALTIAPQRI